MSWDEIAIAAVVLNVLQMVFWPWLLLKSLRKGSKNDRQN